MSLKDKKQELEIPRISLMEGKEIKPDLGFQKHHVYYEKDVAAAVKEYEEVINYLHIENEGDAKILLRHHLKRIFGSYNDDYTNKEQISGFINTPKSISDIWDKEEEK